MSVRKTIFWAFFAAAVLGGSFSCKITSEPVQNTTEVRTVPVHAAGLVGFHLEFGHKGKDSTNTINKRNEQ